MEIFLITSVFLLLLGMQIFNIYKENYHYLQSIGIKKITPCKVLFQSIYLLVFIIFYILIILYLIVVLVFVYTGKH